MTKQLQSNASEFLFARKKLKSPAIINLLLSTSFGLNAIFYAAWLGYSIGIWALLIQLAWSISFFLLIPKSKYFSKVNSLHDLLGQKFDNKTKLIASICSLIGLNYLIAWEVSIDKSVIAPLLPNTSLPPEIFAGMIIGFFVIVAIFYTINFGIKGNANADKFLNALKMVIFIAICSIAIYEFLKLPREMIISSVFPPISKIVINLGIIGFMTNILFNLSWQFVDNSSWQSIISGSKSKSNASAINLKQSGIIIFFTVNLFATILGITLAHFSNLTPDSLFSATAGIIPQFESIVSLGIIMLSIASMMSLADGMILTSALTINVDLFKYFKFAKNYDEKIKMKFIKISVVIFGLISVWGISFIFNILNINLFEFIYIIIITQLALIGPVIFALYSKDSKGANMWKAIIIALFVGFGSVLVGTVSENKVFIDAAGTVTIFSSVFTAWVIVKLKCFNLKLNLR